MQRAAIQWKADFGNPAAQIQVADWFCSGTHGHKVHLNIAAWWYRRAARQGNTVAEQKLGEMYEFGYGMKPNHARALEWIHKATAQDSDSAIGIAVDYLGGSRISASQGCGHFEQVAPDPAAAIEWYRIAADAGSERAETTLGEVYEREPAVQNLEEALSWYHRAAQTSSWAMGDLAHLYETGTGVPRDYSEAVRLYSAAVEHGTYPIHRYDLGLLYEKGLGVPKSREKAMELYAFAAAGGISDAQRRLFNLYEADLHLPDDPGKVIAWYEAAAEAKDRRAQVGLGLHYRYGIGVPQNADVASALYVLAQQSPGGQGDVPSFVVSNNGSRTSDTDVALATALATEMAKPGNLLKAIEEFLARPQKAVQVD
jgi:TPR repeat protein